MFSSPIRFLAQMDAIKGRSNKIIIFGGLSGVPTTKFASFALDAQPNLMKYKMLDVNFIPDENHPELEGRYAFGSCCFNNKIFYFFGSTGYNR